MSLSFFFWCHISLAVNFSFSLSGYIFKSFLVLCFFSLSVNKENSHTFFIYFWQHLILPIWAGLRKIVYSLHHRHVCLLWVLSANWLVWFFLFANLTFPLPYISWASWPIDIQPSNRLLVARGCLPAHIPILRKLDHQLLSTQPWPKLIRLLIYFCWFVRETKRERERESLYLWVKYEFDYPQGPNS